MNKKICWFIFIILVCAGVVLKFSTSHEQMPIGCDEFGYLNQARAMDDGITFDFHVRKPYLEGLLDTLRASGLSENEINWMVTPHAYHVIPSTDKIINQYPPGTAFILSLIPFEFRKLYFPLAVILILMVLPLIAVSKLSAKLNWFHPVFAVLVFIITVSAPFLTELTRVNSVSITFGLLIAAGMLLNKFPSWSLFLIALTVNFRIANLVMILPVFLYFKEAGKHWISIKNILSFTGIVILALLPLLYYNFRLLGDPLSTTYSSIDQAVSGFENALNSIQYYFNPGQFWLRVHIIVLITFILVSILQKLPVSFIIKAMMFPLVNYLFYIFHAVNMDYYPYASALILMGLVLGSLSGFQISERYEKVTYVGIVLIAMFMFGSGWNRYQKREHMNFEEAKKQYELLCDYDIVWADLFSGTSEYVCNNSGFRYGTTSFTARKLAMIYLQQHNYSQIILLDDNTVASEIILKELESTGLSFIQKNDQLIGNYITIK